MIIPDPPVDWLEVELDKMQIEDGDLVIARLPDKTSSAVMRQAAQVLHRKVLDVNIRARSLVMPASFDLERIPARQVKELLSVLAAKDDGG